MKKINLTLSRLKSLDPSDMLGKTLELPQQLRRGIELGKAFVEAHHPTPLHTVDWFGLGGSAVAAELLNGFGVNAVKIAVRRSQHHSTRYRIVSSYSGNTVESLAAFKEVSAERVWFTMSSGGKLEQLSKKAGVAHLALPGGYPPRAAVGFPLGAMMAIQDDLFSLKKKLEDLDWTALDADAIRFGKLDSEENPALAFAAELVDRTPVIYSVDAATMSPIATRFRAQLAENSKVWSHAAELPEFAHNEVESFEMLGQLLPPPYVILLGSWLTGDRFVDPRPGLRSIFDSFKIAHKTLDPQELWGKSVNRLNAGLRMMLFLDAVTVYLSVLRAIDPYEIPLITQLKNTTTKN